MRSTTDVNDPHYWTNRANDMRALAMGLQDDIEVCASVLRIAADYDRLAKLAALRTGGKPSDHSGPFALA
jgi:hypothetical protein